MSKRSIPIQDGDKPVEAETAVEATEPVEETAAADLPEAEVAQVAEAEEAGGADGSNGGGTLGPVEEDASEPSPPGADEPAEAEAPEPPPPTEAELALHKHNVALRAEIGRLRKALDEKDELLQKYIKAYKQAEAEFERVKKRLDDDLARRVEQESGRLATSLFDVLDNLERSLESGRKTQNPEALLQGIEMVHQTFLDKLVDLGIQRFDPEGQPFDPGLHEAMGVVPVPDPALNNHVIQTFQVGYRVGDQVLRAARVIVGKA
jgi:molecular chaperone GrpE